MGAWASEGRATRRRPRPKRWLLVGLISLVAMFVIGGLAPGEQGQDPPGPWVTAIALTFVGVLVCLIGAVIAAIRARRFPGQRHPEDEAGSFAPTVFHLRLMVQHRRALAWGGFALIVVTMLVQRAIFGDEREIGAIDGTLVTIGVCAMIWGLCGMGWVRTRAWAARRMVRNLEGSARIGPTAEEEATLRLVFGRLAGRAASQPGPLAARFSNTAYWQAAVENPTDVRQADLTLDVDPARALALGREAFAGFEGEVLEEEQQLLRGWWFLGGLGRSLNGNPVVVTLTFEPDGLGGTRMTVRSAVKFYLTHQHIAQEALDLMLDALGRHARPHVTA